MAVLDNRLPARLPGLARLLGVGLRILGALLLMGHTSHAVGGASEDLEVLDWENPTLALERLGDLGEQDAFGADASLTEVRGMIYLDARRADSQEPASPVQPGSGPRSRAATYLQGYELFSKGDYIAAGAVLASVPLEGIENPYERFRFLVLRGNSLRRQGQTEAAAPVLSAALKLAMELNDPLRTLHALVWNARLSIDAKDFDAARTALTRAEALAQRTDDEEVLAEVQGGFSQIADRQGDLGGERRASLAEVLHARLSGSPRCEATALVNLSDSYLKSGDYRAALAAAEEAASLGRTGHDSDLQPIVFFNQGLADIGLGANEEGVRLAGVGVRQALDNGDLLHADDMLHELAAALAAAKDYPRALAAYAQFDDVSAQLLQSARHRAYELSASFDDERRLRELEILRRDNAVKSLEVRSRKLEEQLSTAVTGIVICILAALLLAFTRVRRLNERLRRTSERDELTGLHNRRYFNEHVLHAEGSRPAGGCVLLADIDHFKLINDTWGHPAGDAVLAAVSQRLSGALRETDKLVRWGGEEFLAVLDAVSAEQADRTVERLLQIVRSAPVLFNGVQVPVTISIGYACFPLEGSTLPVPLESAIGWVDKALYEAKRRGRDRACLMGGIQTPQGEPLADGACTPRFRWVDLGAAAPRVGVSL